MRKKMADDRKSQAFLENLFADTKTRNHPPLKRLVKAKPIKPSPLVVEAGHSAPPVPVVRKKEISDAQRQAFINLCVRKMEREQYLAELQRQAKEVKIDIESGKQSIREIVKVRGLALLQRPQDLVLFVQQAMRSKGKKIDVQVKAQLEFRQDEMHLDEDKLLAYAAEHDPELIQLHREKQLNLIELEGKLEQAPSSVKQAYELLMRFVGKDPLVLSENTTQAIDRQMYEGKKKHGEIPKDLIAAVERIPEGEYALSVDVLDPADRCHGCGVKRTISPEKEFLCKRCGVSNDPLNVVIGTKLVKR